jgi:hypothetical protein
MRKWIVGLIVIAAVADAGVAYALLTRKSGPVVAKPPPLEDVAKLPPNTNDVITERRKALVDKFFLSADQVGVKAIKILWSENPDVDGDAAVGLFIDNTGSGKQGAILFVWSKEADTWQTFPEPFFEP